MDAMQFIDIAIALLVVSNPLILIQAILGVTAHNTSTRKQTISWLAASLGTGMLITTTFMGAQILSLLGLKIEAFQVAGGIVVIILGFSMLNAKFGMIASAKGRQEFPAAQSGAVIPLAFPLIAGPGAITTVMVNSVRYPGLRNLFLISCACVVLGLISWMLMLSAGYLEKKLGDTAISILGRMGGLILLTLGIQILMGGLAQYFP
jgi:multiple antibiotic resistance protein